MRRVFSGVFSGSFSGSFSGLFPGLVSALSGLVSVLLLAACATPEPEARRETLGVDLAADKALTKRTRRFLRDNDLKSAKDVEAYLRSHPQRKVAYHLAEMAYLQATRTNDRGLYCAAAFYARSYVLDPELGPLPGRFDPLFRPAALIYNHALARYGPGLLRGEQRRFKALGRSYTLDPPKGPQKLQLAKSDATNPTDIRVYGLGLPLIAEQTDTRGYTMAYARTLMVRFDGSAATQGPIRAHGELFDPTVTESVEINGITVPLEADFSTPLRYATARPARTSGIAALLDPGRYLQRGGLYETAPYDQEKIPVVFVHGLASNPRTWLAMLHALMADPVLRQRCQFWFFAYPSGMPIPYSAMVLRESLENARQKYRFDDLVLVGHSMGGLVSRMCVLTSGDRIVGAISKTPFKEWELPEASKSLLARALVFRALPFVKRVVFLATPHRGSADAAGRGGSIGAHLIKLPSSVTQAHEDLLAWLANDPGAQSDRVDPALLSGVGNLRPDHPIQGLVATWRYREGLRVHSVIGNKSAADTPGGTDGTVTYESAHLDGAASEKIVKSGHSVQKSPAGAAEVARILHLHLAGSYGR